MTTRSPFTFPPGASWAPAAARPTRDILVVEALLTLTEPTHVGGHPDPGDELADLPLLTDPDGTPLLLGTTSAGALRAYLRAREFGFRRPHPAAEDKEAWEKERASATVALFGSAKGDDDGLPSLLVVDDARSPTTPLVTDVRDGVALDRGTGTALDKGLFSVECWAAGVEFPLRFELHLPSTAYPEAVSGQPAKETSAAHSQAERSPQPLSDVDLQTYRSRLLEALCGAFEGFEDGWITLGGRRRRGFGAVKVGQWRVRRFDLTQAHGLFGWLREGDAPLETPALETVAALRKKVACLFGLDPMPPFPDERSWVDINLDLQLGGSVLIRSSSGTLEADPDDVHLQAPRIENGMVAHVDILGGTSLGGAIAARARAIAHTVARHDTRAEPGQAPRVHREVERVLRDLFGYVPLPGVRSVSPRASRLHTREATLRSGARSTNRLIQQAVSIDRHSGGTYGSALFDARPVFSDPVEDPKGLPQDGARAELSFRLLAPPDEALALVLLSARDLYEGRLTVGGEGSGGRGLFRGSRFEVTIHEPRHPVTTWKVEGPLDPRYGASPERLKRAVNSLAPPQEA